jgi:hypothetical protein
MRMECVRMKVIEIQCKQDSIIMIRFWEFRCKMSVDPIRIDFLVKSTVQAIFAYDLQFLFVEG